MISLYLFRQKGEEMAKIKLTNVTKVYEDDTKTVDSISFDANDGELIVLLGPTGSGKSQVLRLIAGLDEVNDGEISINDEVVNGLQPKDRNVAVVFKNYQLDTTKNVYENLAFSLKLRKFSAEEINVRVREIARVLNLTEVLNRKPKVLTSLERQRVSLARAIVRNPNVCLLDDVLSGLDETLSKCVRSDMMKIAYRMKQTLIYATRDQIDAMTLGDKIAVMNEGKIEQFDTPKNIYQNPKTVFVATYVGSPIINTAPSKLVKDGENVYVEFLNQKILVGADKLNLIEDRTKYVDEGKELTIAIRPENLGVDNDSAIRFTVDAIENYGSYKVVSLKSNDKTINDWSLMTTEDVDLTIGNEIGVSINAKDLLMFDRETETTIFTQKLSTENN